MAQSKKKLKSSEDKVLKTAVMAVIILFLIGIVVILIGYLNPKPDISEGVSKLEEMDQVKVSSVEKKLRVLEDKEAEEQEAKKNRSNEEIFEKTVLFGDFTAEGFYEQEVIPESYVVASSAASVSEGNSSEMAERLDKAVEKKPETLFLMLGSNDTVIEGSNPETFAENYRAFLSLIKGKFPNTRIFVNSILPVQQTAIEENAGYGQILQFNQELQAVCKEAGVIYLDNGDLVKDEDYKDDGKHMNKKFYERWADRLCEAADL